MTDELVNTSTNEQRVFPDVGHDVEISDAHRVDGAQSKRKREYFKKKPIPLMRDEVSRQENRSDATELNRDERIGENFPRQGASSFPWDG